MHLVSSQILFQHAFVNKIPIAQSYKSLILSLFNCYFVDILILNFIYICICERLFIYIVLCNYIYRNFTFIYTGLLKSNCLFLSNCNLFLHYYSYNN